MSQPPLMRMGGGGGGYYQQPAAVFTPPMVGAMAPNIMPQVRYPMAPFDLSKYPSPGAFSSNPFVGQMPPMNMPAVWNNGMGLVNNRSPFAQPFNDYQQGGWPMMSPSNYGYMPAMQF
jgi:hypothetical protein